MSLCFWEIRYGLGVLLLTHMLLCNATFTDLDDNVLQQLGGMENNSFINILESDPVENDEIGQPHIIKHSSYHQLRGYLQP